jgi:virginiamycin B lyase
MAADPRVVRRGALTVGLAIVTGCGGGTVASAPASPVASRTAAVTPSQPSPTVTLPPSPTPAPLPTVEAAGGKGITVGGSPDWVIVANGVAWTAAGAGLVPLDPQTGEPGDGVPVDGATCTALDAGFHRIWAATCENHSLTAVDPVAHKVASTLVLPTNGDVQYEGSVAAGEGGVWVVTTVPELLKVSPDGHKVIGSWPLPLGTAAVRAGLGWLWVTAPDANTLLRIDPTDPETRTEIAVGRGARFLAVGEGAVWTLDAGTGTVTKVLENGSVAATIRVADGVIDGGDIAVGGGWVWARTSDSLVVQVDPKTGASVRLGPVSGSGSVGADDTAAWISAHDVSTVWRLPLPLKLAASP